MSLIDKKELKEWVENWSYQNKYYHPYSKSNNIPCSELYDILERMPTIDAVEVVRCRDCKNLLECLIRTDDDGERYSRCCLNGVAVGESFFCADGERRSDEQQ